ncbi:MAG: hypothetical protein IJS45_02985 [Clostridia bacterium]|nr:hypothetical protein [Clostridia bacterium]
MADEKKYPWIKSIFGRKKKKNPAEGVYAGPERLEGDREAKCVYAGPEYFNKKRIDVDIEEVYAGPEFFERDPVDENEIEEAPAAPDPDDELPPELRMQKEYLENLPKVPPEMMMCVYAGPEYFSGTERHLGAPAPEGVDLSNLPQWSPEIIHPGDEMKDGKDDV